MGWSIRQLLFSLVRPLFSARLLLNLLRSVFGCLPFVIIELLAATVLLDQLVQRLQVSEDVDASPSIQMGRLQQPQIESVKVALGHRESRVLLLFEIECLHF